MLNTTIYTRVKQTQPMFELTPIHSGILAIAANRLYYDIKAYQRMLGLPFSPVREAIDDLYRAKILSRMVAKKWPYTVVYAVYTTSEGWENWTPSPSEYMVWHECVQHFWRDHEVIADILNMDDDKVKKHLRQLFRAGYLRRRRSGEGKHWFYVYQASRDVYK